MDPVAFPEQLRGDLGLQIEPVAANVQAPEKVCWYQLVACFHIMETGAIDDIGERGERPVSVAEEPLLAIEVAYPVNNLGLALNDGVKQLHVLVWVVLQIGILDDGQVAGGNGERRPHSSSLSLVDLVVDNPKILHLHLVEDFAGAVTGAVVDDYDLLGDGDGRDPPDDLLDGVALVENGYEDGEFQVDGTPSTRVAAL